MNVNVGDIVKPKHHRLGSLLVLDREYKVLQLFAGKIEILFDDDKRGFFDLHRFDVVKYNTFHQMAPPEMELEEIEKAEEVYHGLQNR